jgi:hypothetical protein
MKRFIGFNERSVPMISWVMILLGFVLALMAICGRISLLIYLAIALVLFSWVGLEGLRKVYRLIPIALCLVVGTVAIYRSVIYGLHYYYYDFIAAISIMISVLLLISMLPDAKRRKIR